MDFILKSGIEKQQNLIKNERKKKFLKKKHCAIKKPQGGI
jgi:hypothetical protein